MFKKFIQAMNAIEDLWQVAVKTNALADWRNLYEFIQDCNNDKNANFKFHLEDLDLLQTIVFQIYTDVERGL